MPISLVFQGKFTEKYFKKFHLPKIQFQLLDGRLIAFQKTLRNFLVPREVSREMELEKKICGVLRLKNASKY